MVKISGGDKLEAALKDIAKKLSKASTLEVGFINGATYPNGQPVAQIAAIQEFGAPKAGIPPRPYMRTMIAKESPGWGKLISDALVATDYDAEKALGQAGEVIKAQLQDSIIAMNSPALSPVTLMLRGMRTQAKYRDMPFGKLIAEARTRVAAGKTNYGASTKPLVDHGDMLRAISSSVK